MKPYYYEIIFKPYFSVLKIPDFYEGQVVIKFNCLHDTSKIILHKAFNLEIKNESIVLVDLSPQSKFQSISKLNWTFDARTEFFIIDLKKISLVKNNNYSLSIGFESVLLDLNTGLYRRFYTDTNGDKKFYFIFLGFSFYSKI